MWLGIVAASLYGFIYFCVAVTGRLSTDSGPVSLIRPAGCCELGRLTGRHTRQNHEQADPELRRRVILHRSGGDRVPWLTMWGMSDA